MVKKSKATTAKSKSAPQKAKASTVTKKATKPEKAADTEKRKVNSAKAPTSSKSKTSTASKSLPKKAAAKPKSTKSAKVTTNKPAKTKAGDKAAAGNKAAAPSATASKESKATKKKAISDDAGKAKKNKEAVARTKSILEEIQRQAKAKAKDKSKNKSKTEEELEELNPPSGKSGVNLTEYVKELLSLAQEQGYLTYGDINEVLPEEVITPEDLEEVYNRLRNLDVEIVDQAEVERIKKNDQNDEEDAGRLDILDDPVRMYMKQMGKVPLLTREQEVEICNASKTPKSLSVKSFTAWALPERNILPWLKNSSPNPRKNDLTASFWIKRSTAGTNT